MFNKVTRLIALGFAAALCLSSAAMAQTVLVVDSQKVISDSKVGKYVGQQIASIEKTASSEVQTKLTSVQNKRKNLQTQYGTQTQQQLMQNAAFKSQLEQLLKDEQKFKEEYAKISQEMQITRQKAIVPVMKKFSEIVKAVRAERNASVILDRGQVLDLSAASDVTQTVLSRLNQQMTTTPVVRERLPAK
ncbi:periplasmic chaperone for outer membrane proteins Skp [Litorimonas taeanensis]|uniref:Periplasmic chaperone for outer membrane proteins Skp n=1 Tax=Litorimonas taeanensis TaxID=568099 RepID=A0A420WKT3_9PROT|nr:OmpH family outer membrane protein [Litorimonas taeanensis]RKQ71627.1 periplasmic chaperone for outer membrane proteins Skp [Litorimonas taeanensis]